MTNSINESLAYRIAGNGYPIVFLHGFLEDSSMWNYLSLNPPKVYQFIFIDLAGHGNSDTVFATSTEEMAKQVLATLISIDISDYKIIGHSLGGYIALELLKSTIKPREICLFSSHPFEDTPIRKENRTRLIKLLDKRKEAFLNEAIPNLFYSPELVSKDIKLLIAAANRMNIEHIKNTTLAMRNRKDYQSIVSSAKTKIFYIGGKEDLLIDLNKLKRWAKKEKVNTFIIKNTAHMAHIEKSEIVKGLIKHFITKKI